MTPDQALRTQLAEYLDWHHAHASFDDAIEGIPPKLRVVVPQGFAHSVWQIVEHIRIAQADILDFCVNKNYREKKWPEDYWPKTPGPRNTAAWSKALDAAAIPQRTQAHFGRARAGLLNDVFDHRSRERRCVIGFAAELHRIDQQVFVFLQFALEVDRGGLI